MDLRVERAQRLADLAWKLAVESLTYRPNRGPQILRMARQPVGRRFAGIARQELIEACGYDRGALLRAADLVEQREGPAARVAHWLLVDAVAAITSR